MIKFCALVGTLYGIGVLGVGISRTVSSWDSHDLSALIETALIEGAVWPASLIEWLA